MPVEINSREVLIAGLGSIGRRHLANLRALGWTRVRLYRTGRATLPDADLAAYPVEHDLSAALERRPLAVIVSNPSSLHLPVALAAARAGAHLLVEKPLSHDLDGVAAFEDIVGRRKLQVLVGFQFRFSPGLRQVRAWMDEGAIGTVVSAQAHWGEYLPDMHPWEDHRLGYAARADLGGGVLLTLCHPFDYLRWLLGDVERVSSMASRPHLPGCDAEDCVDVGLRFASGASAHVHLDFVQRPREHRLTIVGSSGTITWTDDDHAARRYCCATKQWEVVAPPPGYQRNDMFLEEMRHFLACLRGDTRPACTLHDGIAALRIALAAKQTIAGAQPAYQTT